MQPDEAPDSIARPEASVPGDAPAAASRPDRAASMQRRALVGGGAAAILLASLYASTRLDVAPPAPAFNVRIAAPVVPHAGLVHLAAARGLFREQGIGVTLLPQSYGKAALAELLRGRVDLAVAADVPVVVEILKGAPLDIVASVANASNELAVLGRVDRGIRTPDDLRGRSIGVTLGTSGEYFLWAFLVRHRIAPQSLRLVDLPPSRLIESLRAGIVDGIAAWQPVRHEAEMAFGNQVVSLHAPDAYAQAYLLVGPKDYVRAHQPELRRVIRALLDAEAFVDTDPQQARTQLAGLLDLNPAAFDPSWQDVTLRVEQQQAQLVTFEDVATWAMARDYAPRQPVPDFVSHLALEPLLAESPGRVTVVR